jgi:tetratricopeptide (TPR) repeat protein
MVTPILVLAIVLTPALRVSDVSVEGPALSVDKVSVEGQQPETLSLLGEPLYAPPLSKEARAKADEDMRAARDAYDKTPNAVPAIVALAQAHLAFGRLGDAIEILTHGLEVNADDPSLLLERGRNYIRLRKFEPAQRDLRKAAEKLPAANCALGLAQYVTGAYPHAQATYATCTEPGIFAYLSARRAGATAPRPNVDRPAESEPEIRLPGSVMKTKSKPQSSLAPGYLDAAELLLEGRKDDATKRLKEIVTKHRNEWMEPVYIAAEADYAKLYKPPHKKKKK